MLGSFGYFIVSGIRWSERDNQSETGNRTEKGFEDRIEKGYENDEFG